MTHGSLFSGIGGFDLAAEWMGWENLFHCEWNEFGQKVLHYYWPDAEQFTDITKTDFRKYANRIDILTGGFPCQPYSLAGKRKGKEDERHLWPEMLRAIREIQPRWVVGENVHGLVNWDGGLVFHEVQTDLEAAGYEVFPYVLPACAINAPHRRDRIWFVAYARHNSEGSARDSCADEGSKFTAIHTPGQVGECKAVFDSRFCNLQRANSDTSSTGREEQHTTTIASRENYNSGDAMHTNGTSKQGEHFRQTGKRKFDRPNSGNGINYFQNFPTESPICSGNDEFPNRLDGITFPKWRNESIKAYGNAVVPALVLQIFKTIEAYEKL